MMRTAAFSSARSATAIAPLKSANASTEVPGRCGSRSFHCERSAAADSGALTMRKSRAPSFVRMIQRPPMWSE